MNKQYVGTVANVIQLSHDVFKVTIKLETMPFITPGQFLNIKIPGHTLRRPFGISGFDEKNKTVEFCFQVRGQGTKTLSKIALGTRLDLLMPLGNGFPQNVYKKVMLISGGIGLFPLLPAAKDSYAFLGFKNKNDVLLLQDFEKVAKQVTVITDGYVTDAAYRHLDEIKPDAIFACGPLAMYKTMKQTFADVNIPIYISMEQRMACGFGSCICCTVDTKAGKSRVCCDGPVFLLSEVIL